MFMMNYADKWSENKVTAITDLESETTSFYAWNGTKLDTELLNKGVPRQRMGIGQIG